MRAILTVTELEAKIIPSATPLASATLAPTLTQAAMAAAPSPFGWTYFISFRNIDPDGDGCIDVDIDTVRITLVTAAQVTVTADVDISQCATSVDVVNEVARVLNNMGFSIAWTGTDNIIVYAYGGEQVNTALDSFLMVATGPNNVIVSLRPTLMGPAISD